MTGPTTTGSIDAKLTVDDSDFKRGMTEAKAEAKEVGALEPTVKVDANVGPALAKLEAVARAERDLDTAYQRTAIAEEKLSTVTKKHGEDSVQAAQARLTLTRAMNSESDAEAKLAGLRRHSTEELDKETGATTRSVQANRQNASVVGALIALSPAILAAAAPIGAAAVGLGAAFGVMGVSGVLALKGIKDAMKVGDQVGNAYAAGIVGLKEDLNTLAGTSATAMLGSFNVAVTNINSQMPSLTQMIHDGSAALGHMGDTALRGVLAGLSEMNPLIHAGEVELSKFVTWLFSFNGTSGFHDFIQYAIDNLPATMHLLENLVTVAGHILAAYAPLGPVMLTLLNGLTDALNGLPLPVLAGLVTTATLLGPALRVAFAPGVAALITSVAEAIGLTGVMANLAVPVVGIITALIAGLGVAAATAAIGTDQNTQATRDYTQALKDDNDTLGEHVRLQAAKALSDAGAFDAARTLGVSQTALTDALMGVAGAQDTVNSAIKRGKEFQNDWSQGVYDGNSGIYVATDAQNKMGKAIDTVTNTLNTQRDGIAKSKQSNEDIAAATESTTGKVTAQSIELQNQANQFGTTAASLQRAKDAQDQAGASTADTTAKMQLQNDAAGLLKMTLDGLNGKAISAAQAQNAFDSSLANMGTHVDKTGKQITFTTTSINDMSSASVALRGQLNGQVQNLENVVAANGGLNESTGKAKAEMEKMRQQIIDNAVAHGVDKDAVTAYVDGLLKIPKSIPPTKLDVDNAEALRKVAALQSMLAGVNSKTIYIDAETSVNGPDIGQVKGVAKNMFHADGGPISYLATGGFPGAPKGTDTVPTWLTPGEFVVKRASAESIGMGNLEYMNRTGQLPPGGQGQQQASAAGFHVDKVEINQQRDPEATFLEFNRRMRLLGT